MEPLRLVQSEESKVEDSIGLPTLMRSLMNVVEQTAMTSNEASLAFQSEDERSLDVRQQLLGWLMIMEGDSQVVDFFRSGGFDRLQLARPDQKPAPLVGRTALRLVRESESGEEKKVRHAPEVELPPVTFSATVRNRIFEYRDGYILDKKWRNNANCLGSDPELFYANANGSDHDLRHVTSICGGCEVWQDCLTTAINLGESFGVWGGTSERRRRRLVIKMIDAGAKASKFSKTEE